MELSCDPEGQKFVINLWRTTLTASWVYQYFWRFARVAESKWQPILIGLDWQLIGKRSKYLRLENWPPILKLGKLATIF